MNLRRTPGVATGRVLPLVTSSFYLAGGALTLLANLDPRLGGDTTAVWVTAGLSMAVGLATLLLRRRLRPAAYHVLGVIATGLVAAQCLAGQGDPMTLAGSFYFLLVALAAAFFFSWRGLIVQVLLIMVAAAAVLLGTGVPTGVVLVVLGCCVAVAAIAGWLARAAELAETDYVTGLPNRRAFAHQMESAVARAGRESGRMALATFDVDRVEADGRAVEPWSNVHLDDAHLRDAALAWGPLIPPGAHLSRYGGYRFCLILPGYLPGAAGAVIDRIVASVPPGLKAVAGVAAWEHGDKPSMLVSRADAALFEAKSSGVPTAVYGDVAHGARELELAIERGEMVLHYQPVVRLRDGRVVGSEALVRWNHPERGLIGPVEFVPRAERTGTIRALGAWTLEEACRTIAAYGHSVSVNASVIELRDRGYAAAVGDLMQRHGVRPGELVIEVTEAVHDAGDPQVHDTLADLRSRGAQVAIDDFGAGYSSLRWLDQLPADYVKIDGSFVDTINDDSTDAPVLRGIIAMCQSLGLAVLAERVETEVQARVLTEMGCDLAQGYYFARPQPLLEGQRPPVSLPL